MPAHESGHPALTRLGGDAADDFARTHWGERPLLSRAAALPLPFSDLLDHGAVDELISQRALRAPFLRVAKEGVTLADRAFTQGGGVGAAVADQVSDDKLLHLFADGATMVLQGLHRSWAPLIAFSQQLAAELGHPVQANAYVTPAQNTGFSDHYDVHDVFVVQIEGEKRWSVRPPVRRSPLRDEPWGERRAEVEAAALRPPLLDVTLRPGDCLYLPRGYLHAATALGMVSIHVTFGVHTWTRRHLADAMVASALRQASEDEALRASLPMGLDLTDVLALTPHVDVVRESIASAINQMGAGELARLMAAAAVTSQRAAPVGVLAQAHAADTLQEGARLTVRPHLAARLVPGDGRTASVRSRAGMLDLDESEVAPVERLLQQGGARVVELGAPLARRLLLAGVVVPG